MLNVAIIIGSTRPGRKAEDVARWVYGIAAKRSDASFEVVDIASFDLPLLDEAVPPSMGQYAQPHTKAWAAKIATFDAFVFVTPEYNHSTSGALKNAIDYLFREWNDKAAGFVGYGGVGGTRAVEQLRLVMGEIKVAAVRPRSPCPFLPTSRISPHSSPVRIRRRRSLPCSMISSPGVRRCRPCERT